MNPYLEKAIKQKIPTDLRKPAVITKKTKIVNGNRFITWGEWEFRGPEKRVQKHVC